MTPQANRVSKYKDVIMIGERINIEQTDLYIDLLAKRKKKVNDELENMKTNHTKSSSINASNHHM